uniref:Uncharacterized protein n=1 Tax=Plectus sambesii TaxID=2011161 RepID=A0A914VEC5_9BILA
MANYAVVAKQLADYSLCMKDAVVQGFEGTLHLKDRHRSLELTILNNTPYTLRYSGVYFDSGTSYYDACAQILPGKGCSWFVANKQGGILTGVTGGTKYSIVGSKNLSLYIGFCNPAIGSLKHYVSVQHDGYSANYGYDQCQDDDMKHFSENGFVLTVEKAESKIAHRRFIYTISI